VPLLTFTWGLLYKGTKKCRSSTLFRLTTVAYSTNVWGLCCKSFTAIKKIFAALCLMSAAYHQSGTLKGAPLVPKH
jgi:hypothetical protein